MKQLQELEMEKVRHAGSTEVLKEVRVSLVMLNTDGDNPKETDESDNDSSTVRLVALQHDETQRMPTVGTKQHLIAKDDACVFENSPEVAEKKSTHCLKKLIEMQQDKCQELGLVETNTFLAITSVLQDNENDILVSKNNKHTFVAKQNLASLVLLELATVTFTKCPLSFTLCLQCCWGTSKTNNQIVPIYSSHTCT